MNYKLFNFLLVVLITIQPLVTIGAAAETIDTPTQTPVVGAGTQSLQSEPPAVSYYTAQDVPALLKRAGIAPENIYPVNTSAVEGDYQWHTFYGETETDLSYSIALDSGGSIFITGGSASSWNGPNGQLPLNAHHGKYTDIFVLKLSSTGDYQWHTFYGGTFNDWGKSIALDNSGSVFVTGYDDSSWDGPAGQPPLHTYSGSNDDVFVLKLSSAGHIPVAHFLWRNR